MQQGYPRRHRDGQDPQRGSDEYRDYESQQRGQESAYGDERGANRAGYPDYNQDRQGYQQDYGRYGHGYGAPHGGPGPGQRASGQGAYGQGLGQQYGGSGGGGWYPGYGGSYAQGGPHSYGQSQGGYGQGGYGQSGGYQAGQGAGGFGGYSTGSGIGGYGSQGQGRGPGPQQGYGDQGRGMRSSWRSGERGQLPPYARPDWYDEGFDPYSGYGPYETYAEWTPTGGSQREQRRDPHGPGGQQESWWQRLWHGGRSRGNPPRGYKRSDDRITEDVAEQLMDAGLDASDVEITVRAGVVVLSGEVNDRYDKYRMEQIASDVSGVTDVENSLRVRKENAQRSGSSVSSSRSPSGADGGRSDTGRTDSTGAQTTQSQTRRN